jgi:serine/threonine-protein kinase
VIALELPGSDGLDTLRSLRCLQAFENVPVLLLATAPSEAQQITAYELGVEEILSHSISSAVLIARLRALLLKQRRSRDVEPHPGMLIENRYRVIRQIGRGGMGAVYLVEELASGATRALKLFHREGDDLESQYERFLREVQVLACLEHPHLIQVLGWGRLDDRGYYVMPHLTGGSLADRLERDGALKPLEALQIIAAVADAVAHAHAHQLLHRDLKPDNILFDDQGRPIVTDFGLVIEAGRRDRRITETGLIIGTPHYMSPEQILEPDKIDHQSDVFSLGILLYEMLTGDVPFGNLHGVDAMLKIAREDITPPIYLNPAIGHQANNVCCQAIQRLRNHRFPSASALANAARQAAESLAARIP